MMSNRKNGYHPIGVPTCLHKQEVGNPARTQHNAVLGQSVVFMMIIRLINCGNYRKAGDFG